MVAEQSVPVWSMHALTPAGSSTITSGVAPDDVWLSMPVWLTIALTSAWIWASLTHVSTGAVYVLSVLGAGQPLTG